MPNEKDQLLYIRKIFFVIQLVTKTAFTREEIFKHFKNTKLFEKIIISVCDEKNVKNGIGLSFRILLVTKEKVSIIFFF